jgi:hypothetical protein
MVVDRSPLGCSCSQFYKAGDWDYNHDLRYVGLPAHQIFCASNPKCQCAKSNRDAALDLAARASAVTKCVVERASTDGHPRSSENAASGDPNTAYVSLIALTAAPWPGWHSPSTDHSQPSGNTRADGLTRPQSTCHLGCATRKYKLFKLFRRTCFCNRLDDSNQDCEEQCFKSRPIRPDVSN